MVAIQGYSMQTKKNASQNILAVRCTRGYFEGNHNIIFELSRNIASNGKIEYRLTKLEVISINLIHKCFLHA